MSAWRPRPVTLEGRHATLVPLEAGHAAGLAEAVRDGEAWRLRYTPVPPRRGWPPSFDRRLGLQAAGSMVPFTVLDAAGVPVGMTTSMRIEPETPRLEIGSTWYAARVRRTGLNTECKLMLLTHAFEALDCIAVEFCTHRSNEDSRRAIERLGARLDGILRSHRMVDGALRDTAVYSIIEHEWPTVRRHLRRQLDRPR